MSQPNPNNLNQPRWSSEECAKAAKLWQSLFVDIYGDDEGPRGARPRVLQRIAIEIGRSAYAVENRLNYYGASFGAGRWKVNGASAQTLAERDARKEAEARRSITSFVFGDPPPGYSALDRRREARR